LLSFVQAGQPSDTIGCEHASKATDYLRAFSEEKREQAASPRAYIKGLENLIIRLDCTLSDLDAERATGSLERDMPVLRKEADRIRYSRRVREAQAELT
jgi:hypothetical protein